MNWSFYKKETGLFTGQKFSGPNFEALELNTPEGLVAIEGFHNHRTRKVSLKTGRVIKHKANRPSLDHEWNGEMEEWVFKKDRAKKERQKSEALAEMHSLELLQMRPIRELQLNPSNKIAIDKLRNIEERILFLRKRVD